MASWCVFDGHIFSKLLLFNCKAYYISGTFAPRTSTHVVIKKPYTFIFNVGPRNYHYLIRCSQEVLVAMLVYSDPSGNIHAFKCKKDIHMKVWTSNKSHRCRANTKKKYYYYRLPRRICLSFLAYEYFILFFGCQANNIIFVAHFFLPAE